MKTVRTKMFCACGRRMSKYARACRACHRAVGARGRAQVRRRREGRHLPAPPRPPARVQQLARLEHVAPVPLPPRHGVGLHRRVGTRGAAAPSSGPAHIRYFVAATSTARSPARPRHDARQLPPVRDAVPVSGPRAVPEPGVLLGTSPPPAPLIPFWLTNIHAVQVVDLGER